MSNCMCISDILEIGLHLCVCVLKSVPYAQRYWCVLLTYIFKTSICGHSVSPANVQRNVICTFQTLQLNIPPMITFNKSSLQILEKKSRFLWTDFMKLSGIQTCVTKTRSSSCPLNPAQSSAVTIL